MAGDGIGDNSDAYPFDPHCYSQTLPCPTKVDVDDSAKALPKVPLDPAQLDKEPVREKLPKDVPKGLPPQGYDEYHPGKRVHHDSNSWSGDWQDEFPRNADTEEETIRRI